MDKMVFCKLQYGLYVVTSFLEGRLNGQISNALFQATSEPARFAMSIHKGNLTHEYLMKSGKAAVSILPESAPMTLIGLFGFKSGRSVDKFSDIQYAIGKNGCPVLKQDCVGTIEADIIGTMDAGTHTIFLCEATDTAITGEGEPMTYEYYHRVKKGKAPPTAPTYQKEGGSKVQNTGKYECSVCGYVYDPAAGDPQSDVAPGTAFDALPDDWTCPVCGAAKSEFNPLG